jgi:signal transduction histidine kinase
MTKGTSPHGEDLSRRWAASGHIDGHLDWGIGWPRLARESALLQLLALSAIAGLTAGLTLTAALQAVVDIGPHLAVLIAACAMTGLALRGGHGGGMATRREETAPDTPSPLLAQMHHDLRTPLNAVIGFSEAMQHELHGPLGNARYQEYAANISESGGRLLKASEDAIAVAATMSRLVAGRRMLRRDRLPASALIEEAWAALGTPTRGVRLNIEGSAAVVGIDCDWQATSQALQHLLDEATSHTAPGGTVMAQTSRNGGAHRIEITARSSQETGNSPPTFASAGGDGMRLILIRSLLEMQGATLRVRRGPQTDGTWSASIVFPPPTWRRMRPARPGKARQRGLPRTREASTQDMGTCAPLVQ